MQAGDHAPPFELPDEQGVPRTLASLLRSGPLVLFFYPQAASPGCTAQACHFRDLASEFAAVGAGRAGISRNAVTAQASFAGSHGFDYPLLSDTDGTTAKAYGVARRGPLPPKRATFVIDTDTRILTVIRSELNMHTHADKALAALRAHAGIGPDYGS